MWKGKNVLVTGGASFIGSHLCDRLVSLGAKVTAIDDLSSGKRENISRDTRLIVGNLFAESVREQIKGFEVVFHLAAEHGGRGYVDRQQCLCSTNLALDNLVFMDCVKYGVEKIVFASSGCVYPNYLQGDPDEEIFLSEVMVPPFDEGGIVLRVDRVCGYDSDKLYGWAKLMAEFTLQAIHKEHGIATSSTRYFTAYGPRAKEDHAVMAMIGRAFIQQNPFEIWGDGTQIRNWTYIDDIVTGTILTAENIHDGRAINIGTMERTSVKEAAKVICDMMGYTPDLKFLLDKPTGPMNRVADNALAKQVFGWVPAVSFREGVEQTIHWYRNSKSVEGVHALFEEQALIDGGRR
jgi:nucleoside-diphosphate-sugar epimerase